MLFYHSMVRFVPGTGKQTEPFVSNVSEGTFLVIVQPDAQILFNVFIYLFIFLYMFRACHAHHQEKQIVSIQLLVIVTPCWWQCRVRVGGKLPTSTRHCYQHGVIITRSCIDTICFS